MQSMTFQIPKMEVTDVDLIKKTLLKIDGMQAVEIHAPTHSVTITWVEPASIDEVWKQLEWLHFTPDFPQTD
jgi:hypothetical protein